jgi:hypothetical protein
MGAHRFGAVAGSADSPITARNGGVVLWSKPPAHLLRAQLSSPAPAAGMRELSMHSVQSVEEAVTAWTISHKRVAGETPRTGFRWGLFGAKHVAKIIFGDVGREPGVFTRAVSRRIRAIRI